jgi:hypothetical protein
MIEWHQESRSIIFYRLGPSLRQQVVPQRRAHVVAARDKELVERYAVHSADGRFDHANAHGRKDTSKSRREGSTVACFASWRRAPIVPNLTTARPHRSRSTRARMPGQNMTVMVDRWQTCTPQDNRIGYSVQLGP